PDARDRVQLAPAGEGGEDGPERPDALAGDDAIDLRLEEVFGQQGGVVPSDYHVATGQEFLDEPGKLKVAEHVHRVARQSDDVGCEVTDRFGQLVGVEAEVEDADVMPIYQRSGGEVLQGDRLGDCPEIAEADHFQSCVRIE